MPFNGAASSAAGIGTVNKQLPKWRGGTPGRRQARVRALIASASSRAVAGLIPSRATGSCVCVRQVVGIVCVVRDDEIETEGDALKDGDGLGVRLALPMGGVQPLEAAAAEAGWKKKRELS